MHFVSVVPAPGAGVTFMSDGWCCLRLLAPDKRKKMDVIIYLSYSGSLQWLSLRD